MNRNRQPPPEADLARLYRDARRAADRERVGRYGPAGFGYPGGYRGSYADRPEYSLPRGRLRPPRPEGSGWPAPIHELDAEAEERHLRALADRDLARSVVAALYQVLGRGADRLSVSALDGMIWLEGELFGEDEAEAALDVARSTPGVQRVRHALYLRY